MNLTSPPFTAISVAEVDPPDLGHIGDGLFSLLDLGPKLSLSKKGGLHIVKSYCLVVSMFPCSMDSADTFTTVT